MSLNIEVIKKIFPVLETMEEGLKYIRKKVNEGNPEAGIQVFHDTIQGFYSVETAMQPISKDLSSNQIEAKSEGLKKTMEVLVQEYESNQGKRAIEILQFTLIPSFKKWKEEIEKILKPYTIS